MIKIQNLKLVIKLEHQNIKMFLQKVTLQNGLKNIPWTYVINDLNGGEIVGTFYENELQKTNQKKLIIEKVIKRKGDKLYVKWKGYDSSFNSWIDKKDSINERIFSRTEIFSKSESWIRLSNHAAKADLKNEIGTHTSSFAKKVGLANLKSDVDKLDIDNFKNMTPNLSNLKSKVDNLDVDKLIHVPVDLSKLSDVVKK